MQLDGLMNIIAPQTGSKASTAKGANPAEGLLEALQGGFENILSDLQNTVVQTAEGLGEALSAVPEALMEKVQELLGGMSDLTQGSSLADFLAQKNVEPEVFGLSKQEAQSLLFDGETFTFKSKTFDLPQALEKLQTKVDSLAQMVQGTLEQKEEATRMFSQDLRNLRSSFERQNIRRPQIATASDDFLSAREAVSAHKHAPMMQAAYQNENKSLFSKYATEPEPVENVLRQPITAAMTTEGLILPEAVTSSSQLVEVGTKAPNQMLDMSNMTNAKPSEVINRIVNYLDQQQLTSKGELDVLVKHDELGQFRLNVARGVDQGAIEMRITSGKEGHRFFTEHEVELVKTLNQNGVKLSDLKIVQSDLIAESGNPKSSNFSNEQGENRGQFQQSSQQRHGQSHDGSERRRQLWEEYRERMGASA